MGNDPRIFKGEIEYFSSKPGGVSVDWFLPRNLTIEEHYFISHAHSDHILGLHNYHYPPFLYFLAKPEHANTKIYCTKVTGDLIMTMDRIDDDLKSELCKHFEFVEPNTEVDIYFGMGDKKEKVNVKIIPANHIPGSVMFLFDDGIKTALYTGDFRYDVRDMNEDMDNLRKFVEGYQKEIDYLYVDVNCLDLARNRKMDQKMLPNRAEIIVELVKFIEKQEAKKVHVDGTLLGMEEVAHGIAKHFNTSIGVRDNNPKKEQYKTVLLKDIDICSPTNDTFLHLSNLNSNNLEKCIDCDENTLQIKASIWWTYFEDNNYSFEDKIAWINQNHYYYYWWAAYSHHSSDYELREFLKLLKYRYLYPINIPSEGNRNKITEEKIKFVNKSVYFSLDNPALSGPKKMIIFVTDKDNSDLQSDGWFQVKQIHCSKLANIHKSANSDLNEADFVIISSLSAIKHIIQANTRMASDLIFRTEFIDKLSLILFDGYPGTMFVFTSLLQSGIISKDQKIDELNSILFKVSLDVENVSFLDLEHCLKQQLKVDSIGNDETLCSIVKTSIKNMILNKNSCKGWELRAEYREHRMRYEEFKLSQQTPVTHKRGRGQDDSSPQSNSGDSKQILNYRLSIPGTPIRTKNVVENNNVISKLGGDEKPNVKRVLFKDDTDINLDDNLSDEEDD